MIRLLHLSDVHFGPRHVPEAAEAVLALAAGRRPDLVVLSGDLTQRAKPEQFRAARLWAARFAAPLLAVPGNHDVPLYRVWERAFAPYGAYRRHFSRELEPVYRDERCVVAGINTAHGWTLKHGRVRERRLREVATALATAAPGAARIVVAHHPLVAPPGGHPPQVVRGAQRAIARLTAAGAELVLSGHNHFTYSVMIPPGDLTVLHAGTATSSRGRAPEHGLNTCNWIEVGERSFAVEHLVFDENARKFRHHGEIEIPRRGV